MDVKKSQMNEMPSRKDNNMLKEDITKGKLTNKQ